MRPRAGFKASINDFSAALRKALGDSIRAGDHGVCRPEIQLGNRIPIGLDNSAVNVLHNRAHSSHAAQKPEHYSAVMYVCHIGRMFPQPTPHPPCAGKIAPIQ